MGGGGAGPSANRGPRLVRRAYKACYFWHFFSFSADYAAESHRGCRGRVLSLPGLLWNETRAPSTCKTLVHCRCVSAEGKQRVPSPPAVEVVRPLLRGADRRCLAGVGGVGGRPGPGLVLVTLWNEDVLEGPGGLWLAAPS